MILSVNTSSVHAAYIYVSDITGGSSGIVYVRDQFEARHGRHAIAEKGSEEPSR